MPSVAKIIAAMRENPRNICYADLAKVYQVLAAIDTKEGAT